MTDIGRPAKKASVPIHRVRKDGNRISFDEHDNASSPKVSVPEQAVISNRDQHSKKTEQPIQDISMPNAQFDVGLLFLANFVHQVVNPMNGVIGTLSNITDGTYSGNVVNQKINASRAQLEQCVSLIRNLAYISDFFFETSDKALRAPVNEAGTSILPQVIIESAQFFQVAAERKRMQFHVGDMVIKYRIDVRPELLKQVFMNLFDNWLKYGSSDQIVNVKSSINRKKDLVVEIYGSSIGFNGVDAENIFTLGFRASQAKSKVAQGSGIGLHVCKQIIERHLSGSIKAEHNGRSGVTKFLISIPKDKWDL